MTHDEIGRLVDQFLDEYQGAIISAPKMTAYLVGHGVNGAEAQLAVGDWEAEINGDVRMQDVERLISEMAIPADARQLTVGDLQRVAAAYVIAADAAVAAAADANDAAERVQDAMIEHGCALAGDLPTDTELVEYGCANDAWLEAKRRAAAFELYLAGMAPA